MKATRPLAAAAWKIAPLLAGLLVASGCSKPPPPRPDVLLVTIDTLRADRTSAYGYPIPTTPVLEALASRGVLYRRAWAESATTGPSHAVLMTGRHFRSLGVTKNGVPLPQEAVTLAEVLRDSGYDTAAFVSSFPMRARFGFAQGFDAFDDAFVLEEASLGRRKPGQEPHDRFAGATLARAAQWLARRADDRPLFVWVHFVDPHAPYRAPEPFEAEWPEETGELLRRYDAEVRYADKQLGLLLEAFAAATPAREDLVVVTSDHGEGLGDHGWLSHGINLYEEAVRIPLVMSWPGRLAQGRIVEEPVALLDVAPTVLSLLGIDAPEFRDGRALVGRLDPQRAIFLQRRDYSSGKEGGKRVRGEMTAVVAGGSKLIVAPGEDRQELYDLDSDPREKLDLLGRGRRGQREAAPTADAAASGRAQALARQLGDWQRDHPAAAATAPVDEETLKALRSLGYVD